MARLLFVTRHALRLSSLASVVAVGIVAALSCRFTTELFYVVVDYATMAKKCVTFTWLHFTHGDRRLSAVTGIANCLVRTAGLFYRHGLRDEMKTTGQWLVISYVVALRLRQYAIEVSRH